MSKFKMKTGFTILEIMIVMVIIGVLASVSVIPYTNYVRSARDARRKVDLENLRAALELYRNNDINGSYPQTVDALTPTYIKTLPTDPQTTTAYTYTPTCDTNTTPVLCSTYTVQATLEKDDLTYIITPSGATSVVPTPGITTIPLPTGGVTGYEIPRPTSTPTVSPTPTTVEVRPTVIPTAQPTPQCSQCAGMATDIKSCDESCLGMKQCVIRGSVCTVNGASNPFCQEQACVSETDDK